MILSPLDSKFSLTVDIFPLQCFFLLTSYENFQAHRKGEGVLQSALVPCGLSLTCFSLCSFAFPVPSLMLQSFTSGVSHLPFLDMGAELGQQLARGLGQGRQTPGPASIPLPSVWSA